MLPLTLALLSRLAILRARLDIQQLLDVDPVFARRLRRPRDSVSDGKEVATIVAATGGGVLQRALTE
jgi:hypothetical protein